MSVSDAGNVGTIVLDQESGYDHDTFKNKFMFPKHCQRVEVDIEYCIELLSIECVSRLKL